MIKNILFTIYTLKRIEQMFCGHHILVQPPPSINAEWKSCPVMSDLMYYGLMCLCLNCG